MNMREYLRARWRRDLLKIVTEELAKRDYNLDDLRYDPGDDEEMFEQLLLLLFPPDGKDKPKT